jgi:beta-glucanase (GH16 family)
MPPVGFNTMDMFNTYAFEWRSDSIKWYVNDQLVRTEPMGNAPPIPQMSAKIMMSMWVFNASYDFGGPDGAQNMYPFTAEYDWFRFYKLDGEEYPKDPAMLSAEDKNASKNNATETDTQG